MAEFGAHFNQNASSERPTIFEVIAQESMTSVLRPAITYALKIVASSRPDRYGWLWRYGDELYTILDFVVQNYYLKKFGGSFSEHFYGLKRAVHFTSLSWSHITNIRSSPSPALLTDRQRHLSLLTLVIIPYMKLKLDHYFTRIKEDHSNGSISYTPRKQAFLLQMKRIFVAVYPFVHCTWESIFLCYQMVYMFSFSDSHSPLVHWICLKLQRLSRQDVLAQAVHGEILFPLVGKTLREKMGSLPRAMSTFLVKLMANGLPVIVFFLKFMEWWYSSDNSQAVASITQLPIPPPPPQPKPAQHGIQLPSHPAQCPLCKRIRTNPTALATSGYVFCYPCIYHYLSQHGCCPVTHLPSALQQLVRLYINEEHA